MSDDQMFGEVDLELENQRLMEANQKLQGRIKRLNAFIVSKDLAIEYLKWDKEKVMMMSEEQETIVIKLTPTYWGYEAEVVVDDE